MKHQDRALVVFTAKSTQTCLEVGGTQSWVLNPKRAKRCPYVVLCQNRYTDWGDGDASHGSAFLLARVRDIVPSTNSKGRWLVRFSEYCPLDIPKAWKGWRNPVRYLALQDLKVNLDTLSFQPMEGGTAPQKNRSRNGQQSIRLEVEAAQRKIANIAGVPIAAVKIAIEFGSPLAA